jgi:CubicO group peptidase (beta-lactamase class C family)
MQAVKPEQVGFSEARLARIDGVLQNYIDTRTVAGIQAVVARCGKIAYHKEFGFKDLEKDEALQPDTLFRIYSMTKPITSTAVLMLMEHGRLQLDDPVADYIPWFKDTQVFRGVTGRGMELDKLERPISIRHLLTHRAGLSYGFDDNDYIDRLYQKRLWRTVDKPPGLTLAQAVEITAGLPLRHQPGTAFHYSFATDVLGYLVEVISGQPFDRFLQTHIFDPLDMQDTCFCVPADKLERFCPVYGPDKKTGLKVVDSATTSDFTNPRRFPSGGGGLISTARDYMRFAQMLLNQGELEGERLLGRKTVEAMTMNHLPNDGRLPDDPSRGFGLGVSVVREPAAFGRLSSPGAYGWSGAAGTHFWIDPVEQLIGLVMIQHMSPDELRLAADFTNLIYQALVD